MVSMLPRIQSVNIADDFSSPVHLGQVEDPRLAATYPLVVHYQVVPLTGVRVRIGQVEEPETDAQSTGWEIRWWYAVETVRGPSGVSRESGTGEEKCGRLLWHQKKVVSLWWIHI